MAIQLDYREQTIANIPVHKRILNRIDWMELHSRPLVTNNTNFDLENDYYTFLALHTGQVLSLTHLLNTLLNPSSPITIVDGLSVIDLFLFIDNEPLSTVTYIYNDSETSAKKTYVFNDAETGEATYDFLVEISSLDSGLIPQIKALIVLYKAAGKTYKITQI